MANLSTAYKIQLQSLVNGWTQVDLMEELEVGSRQTIIKWEGNSAYVLAALDP